MDERPPQRTADCGVAVDSSNEFRPALARPAPRRRRVFPGEDSQLRLMRRWLSSILPGNPALDDVLVAVNELATNALCHTRSGQGGWFAVEVTWTAELIRVAVADMGGTSVPVLRADPEAAHGRGLVLVQALSLRSGVIGDSSGRQVWAEIAWQHLDQNLKPTER